MSMMDLFQNPSFLKSDRFQTSIWAAKLVLMFIGFISILVLLKMAIIPYTFNLVLSTLPQLLASAKSCLSLPFIYIIVNFIIITIAASSNFHHKSTTTMISEEKEIIGHEEQEKVVEDIGMSNNKFITHSSPFDDDDESMEATWRTIMEGEGKMNKSDTRGAWINKAEPFSENGDVDEHVTWAQKELKKFETFNDRVSLKRDISMSSEELNQRAEHFINMFNNQMKLQRLQSHQSFLDMVNGYV